MRMPKRVVRPTIVDVARAARVHPSTVSRALNARSEVSLRAETRERVRSAAERLGYRPSALARSLRLRRTLTLGMLVPDIANPFFPQIIKGAEEVAHENDYTLVLCNTADVPEREATYLRVLREREVDGLLVASTRMTDATIDALRDEGFPFVLVNRSSSGADLAVTVDDRGAAARMVDHLVDQGHRRIAHIAGPQNTTTGLGRAQGAHEALRRRGLGATVVEADAWSELAGYRAARGLFETERPRAIFGANDLIALGAMRAARELGLRVPEDVAFAGFNDIPAAALVGLTTILVPQREMGAAAARLLIARLRSERIARRHVVLPTSLVVRGSSAASLAAEIA